MNYRILLYFTITLITSACSMLSPVQSNNQKTYLLEEKPHFTKNRVNTQATILLIPTKIRPIYNTNKIAYVKTPYEISYFTKHAWAETPAQMFSELLADSLGSTNHFKSVVTPPFSGMAQYILITEITRIQENFTKKRPYIELEVNAQIINAQTNRVIASKKFSSLVPLQTIQPYEGILAANYATKKVLKDIVLFSTKNAGG